MRIVILGSTGMLGGMAMRYFAKAGYDVVGLSRSNGFAIGPSEDFSDMVIRLFQEIVDRQEVLIVNCIGAIKPVFNNPARLAEAIYVNAVFPRQLADWVAAWSKYSKADVKLIHITTDCVFSGVDAPYDEKALHDPLDEYGKSKSLGEPPNCMVLRTSIIGPEWDGNKRSLVEWFLSNNGKEVNGFTNHYWNGLTTLELSKAIDKIIKQNLFKNGTFHLFSTDVSKLEMLEEMKKRFELDIKINPMVAKDSIDRRMSTVHELNGIIQPEPYHLMIKELKEYICSR